MGYRIEYRISQKRNPKKIHYLRLPALTVLFFLVFLALIDTIWSDGAAWLRNTAFFTKGAVAVSALNDFANELRYGELLMTAFSDFCRKLIS